jgi:hypothetical protein
VSPHQTPTLTRTRSLPVFQIVLLVLFLLLCAVGIVSSTAQSPSQDNIAKPSTQERELDDGIPKHLPIRVKVKNLNSGKWTSDLEVEVTNTGNKPIYFLMFSLFFVDVKMENGTDIGFPLRYGRPELYSVENRPTPEDVPIQPGETVFIKAPEGLTKGWEKFRIKHEMPHPKKIGIRFHSLNFGDGTGFHTTGGLPLPKRGGSRGSYGNDMPNITSASLPRVPIDRSQPTRGLSPVNFLPANFSWTIDLLPVPAVSTTQSGICCSGSSCFFLKEFPGEGNCFCTGETPNDVLAIHDCNDRLAECGSMLTIQFICPDGEHTCTNFFIQSCETDPIPTPTPTPTATLAPTPEPVCTDPRPNDSCRCTYRFQSLPDQTPIWDCHLCGNGPQADFSRYQTGCPDTAYLDPTDSYCCQCPIQNCPAGATWNLNVCACVPTVSGGGGDTPPVKGGGGGGGSCYFYSEYYYSDGELMNGNSCSDTYLVEGFVCNGVFNGEARLVSNGCNSAR